MLDEEMVRKNVAALVRARAELIDRTVLLEAMLKRTVEALEERIEEHCPMLPAETWNPCDACDRDTLIAAKARKALLATSG